MTKKVMLFLSVVLVALLAIIEVWLFGFLGSIVDWLSAQNRETFLQTEGWHLAGMAAIVLLALPGIVWFQSLIHSHDVVGHPTIVLLHVDGACTEGLCMRHAHRGRGAAAQDGGFLDRMTSQSVNLLRRWRAADSTLPSVGI